MNVLRQACVACTLPEDNLRRDDDDGQGEGY